MKINKVTKKDGSIAYRASVYLGVDRLTGKKVKTSITGRSEREVRQKAKQASIDFEVNGSTLYKVAHVERYKDLADLWLESYKLTVKPQTYLDTVQLLKKHILPFFGNMKVDKITPVLVQTYVNQLSQVLVNFRVPHSINRRILQHGVILQIIPYNPARDVILPKNGKKGRDNSVKFIDQEDLKTFLDYMDKLSTKKYDYYFENVFYRFLLSTGCRFGEAVALEWSDIDFDTSTISITKNYSRSVDKVSTPKSKAGIREISIDKKLIHLLKLYQNRQRQLFLSLGLSAPIVIFATPTRTYANLSVRQEALTRRCKGAGVPRFTFHALRHTHASLLLNAGLSYKELQYRLGHANISMTLDIYSHLSKDKEKEAVSYFEKALNNL